MASSKREKELARMRAERQGARRAAAAAQRRKRTQILSGVAAGVVVAVIVAFVVLKTTGGSNDTLASTPSASPSSVASPSAAAAAAAAAPNPAGGCRYTPSGVASRKVPLPPTTGIDRVKPQTAVVTTSAGKVTLKLDDAKAPCTVNSFTSLAKAAYFTNTPCHRLTTAGIFVLQCGDPTGQGSGGPGYVFPEENLKGAVYKRGTLAMARTAKPGTNGSQFFLVYKDSRSLPADYTPFGTIVGGLDVLDNIAKVGTTNPTGDGPPKTPVQIKTVTISS